MKLLAFKFGFWAVLLAVSLALPWETWRSAHTQIRARQDEFQRQSAQWADLTTKNAQLTNLAAQAASNSLSTEQFRELLRLRGEMGMLREDAAQVEKLRARNERERARLTQAALPQPLPDPQKIQAHWPKSQLIMAGYADPLSAVETALWAIGRNDPDSVAASVTPDTKSKLAREKWTKHAMPTEELAKATQQIADSLEPDTAFDVVGKETSPQDQNQATVSVYFEGEGRTRRFVMQQMAGEWKLASLGNVWP